MGLALTHISDMADRAVRWIIAAGIIAVVLIALPYKLFELDRYFVPKELVLHVVALAVAMFLLVRRKSLSFDLADGLLAIFLLWSAGSALFATNYWLAQRALGVSVSSAILFWGTRSVADRGHYQSILVAVAFATVLAALLSLAQAYGFESEYFSTNRAPGGTFGNRNFVAHIAVIGLPSLVWCIVTARKPFGALLGSLGSALLAGALVLSRSRAAWLALIVCVVILFVPMLASRKYWVGASVGGRFARLTLAAMIGAMAAIALPNRLNWNSDSPYLDTARNVVDYKKGSGRGRISQYKNSARMALANPFFGVGPGNWPVSYVEFAPSNDRSLADDGMTANPWPSSDWVAFVSERGLVPTLSLVGVFLILLYGSVRRWSQLENGEAVLAQLVLAGTVVATLVVSAFDVLLLLGAPSLLMWSVLGATSGIRHEGRERKLLPRAWGLAAGGMIAISLLSAARSTTQTVSMMTVGRGGITAGWVSGANWDPGSYRINLKIAELYYRRGNCAAARVYAHRAQRLFPHAYAARRVANGCG